MWGGRFSEGPSALLRALNDSFAFDRELFAEDVEGSIAWAHAIGDAGVLTSDEVSTLVDALRSLTLTDSDAEDVHSFVESALREKVGALAGKLHTGRSRNDQVATDLKLWLKKACDDFASLATSLARALAQRAVEEAATPMP
ncbi:MAG TPA: lyase family protein, partial [Thermoanaerobaculia bacterium]